MKKVIWGLVLVLFSVVPTITYAKGAPLFFQTGDELFEIEGAPQFEDGYSVGYACQRLGLFGADVWTWDCELKAINIEEFSVGNLDEQYQAELATEYSLSDRTRNPWNQYGVFVLAIVLVGGLVLKAREKFAADEQVG